MAAKLHLDGLPEQAVTLGLLALLEQIKKARKANEGLKLDTTEHDELESCAKDLLEQLGYQPPKKGKSDLGEVVRDPSQQDLPLSFKPGPRARVTCNNLECRRRFAMPVGEQRRKCPDCGTIQLVVSDEDGNVFRQRALVEPPDDIRALFVRSTSDDLAPLTKAEAKTLKSWRAEHPDHILNGELVEQGDRLADPERPGSGNPLEIVCNDLVGNECRGFTTTDTPGVSVCPKCGQKWRVSLMKREADGLLVPLIQPWSEESDEADDTDAAA